MKNKTSLYTLVALAAISFTLISFADDTSTESDISLNGYWSTGEEIPNRSMKLHFTDGSFELDMKLGEERRTDQGNYLQEENQIFLVIIKGKIETQATLSYEFVDSNTMEITFEKNFYLLERKTK